MPDITSTTNPKIKMCKDLHRARGRARSGQTLVEGPKVFGDFIDGGLMPSLVLARADDISTLEICAAAGLPLTTVSDAALQAAADTVTAQGPVAVFPIPKPSILREQDTVVLVDVADPGNVGTIIRSAAAFGWDVAYTSGTADPWSPKTIRAGAGAHARTRLIPVEDPARELESSGHRTVATVVDGGDEPQNSEKVVGLLIGSEAHGLPSAVVAKCHATISIAMVEGTESLNAPVAASIAMWMLK